MRSSFPALKARNQFSKVDLGRERRIDASLTDRPPSVTSRTASRRNSFVYLLYGSFSILTPPSIVYHKLWCPFFSTYPIPHIKYSKELRLEAVRLVTESGLSVHEASMRLSLPKSTLEGWLRAIREITEYIEVFYNRQRIQKQLGYQSPAAYERRYYEQRLAA